MVTSPVMRPTSLNSSENSLYFWLLRALIGVVQITLCFSFKDMAMAYLKIIIISFRIFKFIKLLELTLQQQSFQQKCELKQEQTVNSAGRGWLLFGKGPVRMDIPLLGGHCRVSEEHSLYLEGQQLHGYTALEYPECGWRFWARKGAEHHHPRQAHLHHHFLLKPLHSLREVHYHQLWVVAFWHQSLASLYCMDMIQVIILKDDNLNGNLPGIRFGFNSTSTNDRSLNVGFFSENAKKVVNIIHFFSSQQIETRRNNQNDMCNVLLPLRQVFDRLLLSYEDDSVAFIYFSFIFFATNFYKKKMCFKIVNCYTF